MAQTNRFSLSLLLAVLLTVGCSSTAVTDPAEHDHHHSPYTEGYGEDSALSTDEAENLLSAAGMGFARAAELNSHPGPRHVIDMADELELTQEQLRITSETYDSMYDDAVSLGRRIVEKERELFRRFQHSHIDESTLDQLVGEIAILRGALRSTHLRAHLVMRKILDEDQIRKYDQLRGYR